MSQTKAITASQTANIHCLPKKFFTFTEASATHPELCIRQIKQSQKWHPDNYVFLIQLFWLEK